MSCEALRQQDEMFCPKCGLRWSVYEDFQCPRELEGGFEDQKVLRIAKAIIGPHTPNHIGREMMLRLRDHKWDRLTSHERSEALSAARAVYAEKDQI